MREYEIRSQSASRRIGRRSQIRSKSSLFSLRFECWDEGHGLGNLLTSVARERHGIDAAYFSSLRSVGTVREAEATNQQLFPDLDLILLRPESYSTLYTTETLLSASAKLYDRKEKIYCFSWLRKIQRATFESFALGFSGSPSHVPSSRLFFSHASERAMPAPRGSTARPMPSITSSAIADLC